MRKFAILMLATATSIAVMTFDASARPKQVSAKPAGQTVCSTNYSHGFVGCR